MFATTYEQVVLRDRPHAYYKPAGGGPGDRVLNRATGIPLGDGASSAGRYILNGPQAFDLGVVANRMMPGLPGAAEPIASFITTTSPASGNLTRSGWIETTPTALSTNVTPSATGNGTIELWFCPIDATDASRYVLSSRPVGSIANRTYATVYMVGSTRKLHAYWAFLTRIDSQDEVRMNGWNHCVVVYRQDVNFELWLNGRRQGVATGAGASNVLFTAGEEYRTTFGAAASNIGSGSEGGYNGDGSSSALVSFNGGIADCAQYPHALTPSQIIDHYQVGLGMRRRTARLASIMYPFAGEAPEPPPGGLTAITEGLPNRRVLLVSDRPR